VGVASRVEDVGMRTLVALVTPIPETFGIASPPATGVMIGRDFLGGRQ
jgi:hypothetical protein